MLFTNSGCELSVDLMILSEVVLGPIENTPLVKMAKLKKIGLQELCLSREVGLSERMTNLSVR